MSTIFHRRGIRSAATGSARILRVGFGILPKSFFRLSQYVESPSVTCPGNEERGKMPRTTRRMRALPILLALGLPLFAAEKPARSPDRTELWVPSTDLERVLEKNKNAVLLTPEQYNALIRDAGKLKPGEATKPPPVGAAVESIRLTGKVTDGESGIRLKGEINARALAKGWSATNITLPWQAIGKLSTTGDTLLSTHTSSAKGGKSAAPVSGTVVLTMKGPAQHRIEFECAARINQGGSPDERVLFFTPTTVPAVLELELPAGSQITQGPSRETKGNVHRFFLNAAQGPGSIIAWRLAPAAGSVSRVSGQSIRGTCRVSGSELSSTYDVLMSSTVTDSPAREIAFTVSPPNASVIAVEGKKVESWLQTGTALTVKLTGEARSPQLRVELRVPFALPEKEPLQVEVPALLLSGARQVPAIVEMTLDEGVELLELQANRSPLATVAEWDAAIGKATATIRRISPRIVVDADARVVVGRDLVEIERTLNVATDVPVDHLHVKLPDDEELLEVNWLSGPKLEWKRVAQTVEVEWQGYVNAQTPGKLAIKSRKKLDPAAASQTLSITNVIIEDAKKLAGYVALDHEPGWRVALKETSGLEDRDIRLTPVKGKMAWFNLRDFRIGFEVQRKDSVVDAEVTAYALPRAKSVEIEGQIALDITGAALRQIEVRVTTEMAKLLRFTSPLIGEQTLDESTGAWKLTLTRESTGRVVLRFRLSLPGKADAPNGTATTLVATLPRFEIPTSRRFRGSWVVEANTDTQLSFATQSLQPIDVMRVPAVEDYTPRHRLVAAFAYGTGAHELTVTAARHANSELAALVVNQLNLTSVLSQDGTSKHEAILQLRHSGEQFAHVKLPAGSQLLSVIVDGRAVKPVRGENEAIAIPLPGGSANADQVTARLIYELPGELWSTQGARKLEPITILGNAPILATDWKVRVPDGFSYDKVVTGLEQSGTFEPVEIVSKLNPLQLLLMPTFNSVRRPAPTSSAHAPAFEIRDEVMPLPQMPEGKKMAQKKRSLTHAETEPAAAAGAPLLPQIQVDAALGQSSKSGLIPLELDLPTSGQLLHFSGTQAPEVLSLRYVSWERQMAMACVMMALGGLVFVLWGRRRAFLRTVFVVLVLSLGVKLIAESWLPLANAALFGWLVALGIWIVARVLNWIGRKVGGELEMRKGVEA